MSDAQTAKIEVLTAEVRALMIGSRQVTLSVYRQLDRVPADICEPFGRVRDTQDRGDAVFVVGKDSRTGDLVRAARERPPLRHPVVLESPPWIAAWCDSREYVWHRRPSRDSFTSGEFQAEIMRDRDIAVYAWLPEPDWFDHVECGKRLSRNPITLDEDDCRCSFNQDGSWRGHWDVEDSDFDAAQAMRVLAAEALADLRMLHTEYVEWSQLPLIVLAGLK